MLKLYKYKLYPNTEQEKRLEVVSLTLAYVVGLFDGEGSITICVSKPKKGTESPHYWLQVSITNTDRELIEWLHTTFGGHISDNSHYRNRKGRRPCWAWRIMSMQAMEFLSAIQPFLRVKKTTSADRNRVSKIYEYTKVKQETNYRGYTEARSVSPGIT